ncbi:MAG: hypothetical protein HY238_17335 [Acidobacteria bacterium]|nr:hypothetical protein [Acidobacteriota bacterium]
MTATAIDVQKIAVKLFTDAPPTLNLDPFLSIFSRWRTDAADPARWVDLADYAHMPRGPGIVLIGHVCNFSFDLSAPAPGVLYSRKQGLDGSNEDRLRAVLRAAAEMSRRLLAEPEFPAGVHLLPGSLDIRFQDRLETPNADATDHLLRPAVTAVFDGLLGPGAYQARRQPDPGKLYGFSIESAVPFPWML